MGSFDYLYEEYPSAGSSAVFTAFDLETTGLDPQKDRIAEIGAVKFDRRGLICRFSTLIDPGIPMPPGAGRVNNISDEMLKGQPSLEEVFPDFLRFIGNSTLVAHNAPFDCGFLNEKLKASRESLSWTAPFSSLPNRVVDTLVFAREVLPGRKSYKLQELASDLNIRAVYAHRAEDDARICMEVFIRLIEAGRIGAGRA
jgi:DNA polymerase-3 subunit epsilon